MSTKPSRWGPSWNATDDEWETLVMDVQHYLIIHDLTHREFCELAGVSSIAKLLNGEQSSMSQTNYDKLKAQLADRTVPQLTTAPAVAAADLVIEQQRTNALLMELVELNRQILDVLSVSPPMAAKPALPPIIKTKRPYRRKVDADGQVHQETERLVLPQLVDSPLAAVTGPRVGPLAPPAPYTPQGELPRYEDALAELQHHKQSPIANFTEIEPVFDPTGNETPGSISARTGLFHAQRKKA